MTESPSYNQNKLKIGHFGNVLVVSEAQNLPKSFRFRDRPSYNSLNSDFSDLRKLAKILRKQKGSSCDSDLQASTCSPFLESVALLVSIFVFGTWKMTWHRFKIILLPPQSLRNCVNLLISTKTALEMLAKSTLENNSTMRNIFLIIVKNAIIFWLGVSLMLPRNIYYLMIIFFTAYTELQI